MRVLCYVSKMGAISHNAILNIQSIHLTIVVIALSAILIIISINIFSADNVAAQQMQLQQQQLSSPLSVNNNNSTIIAKLLADNLGNQLNKSAAIMEFTGTLPEVKKVPFADSINSTLHGISGDKDIEKRMVARTILSKYPEFETIFFLLPNGDIYVSEPYAQQLNLTKNSYAFRDYYKGATSTHKTYLGEVVVSHGTGHKVGVIAVPVYSSSPSNNTSNANVSRLVGIWAGAFDLNHFNKLLTTLDIYNNYRIVYLDQHGNEVADSGSKQQQQLQSSSTITHYTDLLSFKNALAGKAGINVETINGTKTVVSYSSANAVQAKWIVLVEHPTNIH
jgi:cache domain-containing protein